MTYDRAIDYDGSLDAVTFSGGMRGEAPPGIYAIDALGGNILFFNDSFCQIWDLRQLIEQMRNGSLDSDAIGRIMERQTEHAWQECLQGNGVPDPDGPGADILALRNGRIIRRFRDAIAGGNGELAGRLYVFEDVTWRMHAEDELHKLSMAIEQSPNSIAITDARNTITYVNPAFTEWTGYSSADAIGKPGSFLLEDTGKPEEIEAVAVIIESGNAWKGEHAYARKDGSVGWASMMLTPIRNRGGTMIGWVSIVEDVTERKLAEERIRASLREKEVLLKEIHHRVKNNMQVISSLLSLQASSIGDPRVLELLDDSMHRIRTIALVHEKIYGSDDLSIVDFKEYLRNLTNYLQHAYCTFTGRISLSIEGDAIRLSANVAVPCGLIINELVSNCFKHAFKDGQAGNIRVSLADGERYVITVEDDGIGLPDGFDFRESGTMGMQLVHTLADQIDGDVAMYSAHGTRFTITFPADS